MKLNISFPATGCQKLIEVDDERKLRTFHEKRVATEVAADALGEEWKGYVVRIGCGNDRQGSPIKHACLLLSEGHPVVERGGLEKQRATLFRTAVWKPISVFSTWL